MKKTYINPEMEVEKCETLGMLAASIVVDENNPITNPEEIGAHELNFDEEF